MIRLSCRLPSTSLESTFDGDPRSVKIDWTDENRRIYWNSKIGQSPPTVDYKGIMPAEAQGGKSNSTILDCLDKVVSRPTLEYRVSWTGLLIAQHEFGFCFVSGVPATPEDTEALIKTIAPIRETHCK